MARRSTSALVWAVGALSAIAASALSSYQLLHPLFAADEVLGGRSPALPGASPPPPPPVANGKSSLPFAIAAGDERNLDARLWNSPSVPNCANDPSERVSVPSVYLRSVETFVVALEIAVPTNTELFVTQSAPCESVLSCCAAAANGDRVVVMPVGALVGLHFPGYDPDNLDTADFSLGVESAQRLESPPPPTAPPSPPSVFAVGETEACCNASLVADVRVRPGLGLCARMCAAVGACDAFGEDGQACRLLRLDGLGNATCAECRSVRFDT